MKTIYDKVIVIGLGKLAFQCAEYISNLYKINVELYDANDKPSTYLRKNCCNTNINYYCVSKNEMIKNLEEYEEEILILSVYNPYILPKTVLDKSNIFALNLHHALLPNHPGRYAEAWAIYEQNEFAGITWHILTNKVDSGNIISQKKIKINEDTTSVSLLHDMNDIAYNAFVEFIESVMNGDVKSTPQIKEGRVRFHFTKDKPNNGFLDLEWLGDKISAFLRAYDYFVASPFGIPRVIYESNIYIWKRYTITRSNDINVNTEIYNDSLIIRKPKMTIKLNGLKKVVEEFDLSF